MYDLGEQFKIDINNASSNQDNIILGNKYRFTVLTDRLIRLEYNEFGKFNDLPTEFAWFRNFDKVNFNVKQDDKILEIATSKFKLEYLKDKPFVHNKINPGNNLRVTLLKDDKVWYVTHPEARRFDSIFLNKKNTIRGLYSLDGFASFDDTKSLIITEAGNLINSESQYDIYLFMYDDYYNDALKDYFLLTGMPPLIPRYALGNWWSRNLPYTDSDVVDLANRFERENIPLSIMLLDNDWHITNVLNSNNDVYKTRSGFSFNQDLIKDPLGLVKKLHSKNIRVGLNINPEEGIHSHEMYFDKIKEYLPLEKNNMVKFDPLNPRFLDVYFKLLINPLESYNIDFFWNDYNNNNLIYNFILNHYHFLDFHKNPSKRGMLLARPSYVAAHRYSVLYTGKSEATWDMLRSIPKSFNDASNLGLSFLSYDIGGSHGGIEESELYIRSTQLGVFSPILRFSSESSKYYKREPWRWDIKTKTVVEEYLNLRHKLIPYLYTESYKYHSDGVPLIRPLYYDNDWIYDDKTYSSQYYLGKELMIAPILDKKDNVMNRTIQKIFIPEGIWYDFKTGKKFTGNKKHLSFYKEEEYPVFAKGGAIIPLSNESGPNNIGNPSELEIHIFPGQNNTYILYEDDGMTDLYKEHYYLKTSIDYNYLPSNYTVIIRSLEGKKGLVPNKRTYKIRFRNTKEANEVIANFNKDKKEVKSFVDGNDFVVVVENVDSIGQLTLNCKGSDIEIEASRVINDDIDSILLDLQISTTLKENLSDIIFSNLQLRKKRVEIRKLKSKGLDKQYIKLFLKLLDYLVEF